MKIHNPSFAAYAIAALAAAFLVLPAAESLAATFPITFEVPGHVANKGVYVGLFGQNVGSATGGNGTYNYLTYGSNGTASAAQTTSLSTLVTIPVQQTSTTLPVASVGGFPPSGNLTITLNGNSTTSATYNGTQGASFLNVVFATPSGPPLFAGNQVRLTSNSSISTTVLPNGLGPTSVEIPVLSVANFASSGNLVLSTGASQVNVSYNGTNASSVPNKFTGVVFANPSGPGIADGFLVSIPNVLGSTITVASTAGFPGNGTLMLQTPAGITPPQNVVVSYTGITSNSTYSSFNGVAPYPGGGSFSQTLLSGGPVIQQLAASSGGGNVTTYVLPTPGSNLAMINLFPNAGSYPDNSTQNATINLPDPATNGILSGVAVISVGSEIAIPIGGSPIAPSLGSPTPSTNPSDIFGIFEWGLVGTGVNGTLDFDVSEVDQVGFPFSSTTTGTPPPLPADPVKGVGLLQNRATLFTGFKAFLNSQPSSANATVFLEGAADNPNAPFPINTRLTAPQDIIGVLQADPPVILDVALATSSSGNQTATIYYAVTATSASGGESMASNVDYNQFNYTESSPPSLQISWSPYPYATGYNIYWSSNASFSSPIKIGSTVGVGNTTFTDSTPLSHTGNSTTPPINNYGYDPLNSYLTDVIKDFFDYYSPSGGNATFVLDDEATDTRWSGQTGNVTMNGVSYPMLQLTGSSGGWGNSTHVGKTLNVLRPLFSSNTENSTYPPPPIISSGAIPALTNQQLPFITTGTIVTTQDGNNWVYNGSGDKTSQASYTQSGTGTQGMSLSVSESPSAMAFGADGVFGNFVGSGTTLDVGNAKNVYNNIVSALNRGITPRLSSGNWTNTISPNYWANAPVLSSANQTTSGNLTSSGTYRYWVTAVGLWGDGTSAETTPSNVLPVTLGSSNQTVTIGWARINASGNGSLTAASFNVYRSQFSSGNWTTPGLIGTVTNNATTPVAFFTDNGSSTPGQQPTNQWYQPGTKSNYYLAYFSQYDVSINGLSYGFAYADKGGLSTNVQMKPQPSGLVVTLNPWTVSGPTPAIQVTGMLSPFTTTNGTASAAQTFSASGTSLTANISISSPPSFELSTNNSTYSSGLSLTLANGTVSDTTIYVRLAASAPVGTPSGLILLSSSNATTQSLTVNGTVTSGAQSPYNAWLTNYSSLTGNATLGTADPDGDGLSNDLEFAFDGDPTVPTSSLLGISSGGGNVTVTFVARKTNPPGASYQVQSTTNLVGGFLDDNSVTPVVSGDQSGILLPSEYQRMQFTAPMSGSKVFYRVKATLSP